jgi:2-dehydro-3-deoxyphosphooctonate aldolase (KDO 8-P synthase)
MRAPLGIPVLTDVHEREHCKPVAGVTDVLRSPVCLYRQADLIIAAAETGRW